MNPGVSQEQQVLLPTESSIQPCNLLLKDIISDLEAVLPHKWLYKSQSEEHYQTGILRMNV